MTRSKPSSYLAALALFVSSVLLATHAGAAADPAGAPAAERKTEGEAQKPDGHKFEPFKAEAVTSNGSVTIGGHAITYQAIAGTLIVHPKGWDDVPRDPKPRNRRRRAARRARRPGIRRPKPRCSTSPTSGAAAARGPITFLYNGGPGSSTMWLHMGAFGPRRIVTASDAHTPAAPYSLVNNGSSLLDATDLVFIDAPGTGFSRIAGKDKEKAFFGVDPDAYAFSEFITQFLAKYGRWNSPKYLFGESYGTPRSAVVVNELEADRLIDLNGVILLSQILNFDLSPDRPTGNPGIDLPYQTVAADLRRHRLVSPQAARRAPATSRRCSPKWSSSPWATTRARSPPARISRRQ